MEIITTEESIKSKIFFIRGLQVMLDSDLARLYQVSTKRLNQAVKRNIERFPENFMFQLTEREKNKLVTNCDHLQSLKFSYQPHYVFTEQGVAMLSAILRSDMAIQVSIHIINAFVSMRRFISKNAEIFCRLDIVERKQIEYQIQTDKSFEKVFEAIQSKDIKPDKGIFFEGQIFDAYKFISQLIKSAKSSIILIDNYIDEEVLTLFSKRTYSVKVTIYTNYSKQLELDLKKFNLQYAQIEIKAFNKSHDRFMIIDNKEVYHIGASLKDLGKKWFAFSNFDKDAIKILDKLS